MTDDSVYRSHLIGKRFNRLVILHCIPGYTKDGKSMDAQAWCKCDCGTEKYVRISCLYKTTGSCGCLAKELNSTRAKDRIKHGFARRGNLVTPEYRCWQHMKERCLNFKCKYYHYYGGRGIKVCQRWLNGFIYFLEDVGNRPSSEYTLDRIDNNGDYEPGNVRWATMKEQHHNNRLTRDGKGRFISVENV